MWQLLILKAIPLLVTFVLAALLPFAIRRRTHELAVDNLLLADERTNPESHDTMEYLLCWRDLMTGVITGLFVVVFAVVNKIIEKITSNYSVTTDHTIPWNVVIIVVIIFILFLLLLAIEWVLTDKMGLRPMQSKLMYWLLFIGLVGPWYVCSFCISTFI